MMLQTKVECIQSKDKMKSEPNSSLSFPLKLYTLLDNEDGDVVKWVPHGFAFIITNQEKLVYDILPKYFKHTKLTSFQRQLNLYGFRRLTKGDDQGAYFHPKFQRNRKDLAYELHRLPPKGSLATIDQVINANRLLPSERYGNTNKASIKNNNSESYNDKYHSSKVVPPPQQQQQQQQQSFSSSKVATTTKPIASSAVVTSRPLTKSKVTMNLGFNMKQYSKDPSSSSSSSSNGGCAYNPPISRHNNNNNDDKNNFEETINTSTVVDFDTLNNSMMMMSSCNSSNNPWMNESNLGHSSSLNDVIELLHPTTDDNYDDNNNNNRNNSPGRNSSSRNSNCHDNGDHTDNDNYQSQQVYDRMNYDADNYLGVFELDDDDLNNFFYHDTGVDS